MPASIRHAPRATSSVMSMPHSGLARRGMLGDSAAGVALLDEALALAERLGDRRRLAAALGERGLTDTRWASVSTPCSCLTRWPDSQPRR